MPTETITAPKEILLGSGHLYLMLYTGQAIPSEDTICVEANRLGFISGGATLEYKPTKYTAKDDMGYVAKTILQTEDATLKSGILTFNGKTFEKLSDTGRVTVDTATKRTTLIGGVSNAKNARYILCFHHEDPADSDVYVTIVGANQAGFTLSFLKDKETVIDAEFVCEPQDNSGTLIRYTELFKESDSGQGGQASG